MILDINDIWKRERASRGKWSLSHDTGYQQKSIWTRLLCKIQACRRKVMKGNNVRYFQNRRVISFWFLYSYRSGYLQHRSLGRIA